jgi:arylsulfatase A-like enzyme
LYGDLLLGSREKSDKKVGPIFLWGSPLFLAPQKNQKNRPTRLGRREQNRSGTSACCDGDADLFLWSLSGAFRDLVFFCGHLASEMGKVMSIRVVLASFFCLVLTGQIAPGPLEAAPGRPPNIVLIVSDDQAWTDFGFMKHTAVHTPHLDRLAARSAVFRRGYVPSSLCRPSLATLITGLYPHQHGITGNDPPPGTDRSALLKHIRRATTLPELLASRGYRSFQSGKWWEGNYAEAGFTAGMTHGAPKHGGRHGDEGLRIGREGLKPVFDFINSCGETPYFLWYAPMMPHLPHDPPKRLLLKYLSPRRPVAVSKYYAMCEWFDETCGELLDFLKRKGQTEKTLVVFVVDNGWIAPSEEARHSHPPVQFAPRSKNSPYDGGVRTPILVSLPGTIAPADYPTLVSSIDIAPTILAAAGISKPPSMPGVNLFQVLADRGHLARTTVFGEIFSHNVADIDDPAASLEYRWCVDRNWKLILPANRSQGAELYDVLADPFERHNQIRSQPQVLRRLSEEIEAWWPVGRSRVVEPRS